MAHSCRSRRWRWLVAWATASIALAVFASPALAASTWFVNATGGSDSNNCMAAGSACSTIGHAVSLAAGGDTIQIAAGTYNEAVSTGLDLTFVGAGSQGGGATVIDSTGQHAPALLLTGTDTVKDLALITNDAGIGGALNVSAPGAVTGTNLDITTNPGDQYGSDGIDAGGASLTISNSTIKVTNSDTGVDNTTSTSCVIQDGSAIEMTAGTLTLSTSTLQAVQGMALRIHGTTSQTTVRDSVLESSGTEDLATNDPYYPDDQWPVIEAGAGPLSLTGDTVYNATLPNTNDYASGSGSTERIYAHTDALWVPGGCAGTAAVGNTVTVKNTILQTQPNPVPINRGADIDTGAAVTAADSAYTTVATNGSGAATAIGTNGNIVGDTGLNNVAGGDFSLAPGSALLGAGDDLAVQNNETDVHGDPRDQACSPNPITNIGAFETVVPQCPAPLSTGDTTGALTQLNGASNCVTGDTQANSGCGSSAAAGMTGGSPTDTVQSADDNNVYTASEDPSGNGVDIAEFSRGADRGLTQLAAPDNCVGSSAGTTSGCGNATGDVALQYALNGSTSEPIVEPTRMTTTPDGKNLYVDNGSTIAEFARNTQTGALTPLAATDCITSQSSSGSSCTYTDQFQAAVAAASFLVAPNGRDVYLATLNQCSLAVSARAQSVTATAPGDNQNPNCNNTTNGFFAGADIAQLTRDPSTGVLTPTACYDNATYRSQSCTPGFDGLYGMTSMALSPGGDQLYVTSDWGALPGSGGGPYAPLLRDPGEITELAVDSSTGDLSQMIGAGACVTAGSACGSDNAGVHDVPGVADPQQIVISPDGLNAYVTGAQYINGGFNESSSNNGPLIATTLAQLTRDPSTGQLSSLSGATCFAGYHEACGSDTGPDANVTQVPGLTGAEALAISPDGQSVYATAQTAADSAVVEFARDLGSGRLTPLSTPDLCLSNGTAPGASSPFDCGTTTAAGLSAAVPALPGGVLVAPDCKSALVMSDGVAEFARSLPASSSGCEVAGAGPAVSLSPHGLTFASEPNSTSAGQTVTVTNSGTSDLSFAAGSITVAGTDAADFKISADTCSAKSIAPAGNCSFTVSFTAPAGGDFSAQAQIADNAADTPQTVNLRGTGQLPAASLSATTLAFGSTAATIAVGGTASQTLEVTDSGQASLVIGKLSLAGPQASSFSLGPDGCSGQTVAAGAACSVSVNFSPTAVGSFSAQLSVSDDASGSPQSVALTGVSGGTATVALGASSLSFAGDEHKAVSITNTSRYVGLSIASITLVGSQAADFAEQSKCPGTLAPGAVCSVDVAFTPKSLGSYAAQLRVSDDAAGSPQTVSLSGKAVPALSGTVLNGSVKPNKPVPGASIYLCPQKSIFGPDCVTVTSAANGNYSAPNLPAGSWSIQLSPPGNLAPASAIVTVTVGLATTQNFILHPPQGLSHGVVFKTQGDTVSSGVPTVNWTTPFEVDMPMNVPKHHPANSTLLIAHAVGMTAGGSVGGGFNIAGVVLFAVHYGAGGTPSGMTTPFVGQAQCSSACSALGAAGSGSPGGSPGVVLAYIPGGVEVIISGPNGSSVPLRIVTYSYPGLSSGPDPLSNSPVDLALTPQPTGSGSPYKSLEDLLDALIQHPDENSNEADEMAQGDGGLTVDMPSVDASYHGEFSWFNAGDQGEAGPQSGALANDQVDVFYPDTPGGLTDAAMEALDAQYLNRDVSSGASDATIADDLQAHNSEVDSSSLDDIENQLKVSDDDVANLLDNEGIDPPAGYTDWNQYLDLNGELPDPPPASTGYSDWGDVFAAADKAAAADEDFANWLDDNSVPIPGGYDSWTDYLHQNGTLPDDPPFQSGYDDWNSLIEGYAQTDDEAFSAHLAGSNLDNSDFADWLDAAGEPPPDGYIDWGDYVEQHGGDLPDTAPGGGSWDGVYQALREGYLEDQDFAGYLDDNGIEPPDGYDSWAQYLDDNYTLPESPPDGFGSWFDLIADLDEVNAADGNMADQKVNQPADDCGDCGAIDYGDDDDDGGDGYMDPSGVVRSTGGIPVAGARVTITRSSTAKGRQKKVPQGSTILSPANRRNPSISTIQGLFDWDTISGYYQIGATRSGCTAQRGRAKVGRTKVFAVPPPRSKLVVELRCAHLHRAATAIRLKTTRGRFGTLMIRVTLAPAHGRAGKGALAGALVVFRGRRKLADVAVNTRTGVEMVDLGGKLAPKSIVVSFSGNGRYAPSRKRG